MARRKDGGDETRIDCDAIDRDEQWQAIYAILRANIGDFHAANWFGQCRFLSVRNGAIMLEHWCTFAAQESLNRHGLALCKAAGVQKALMRFNGGTVPQGCVGRKADGHAEYRIPAYVAPDLAARKNFTREALVDLTSKKRLPPLQPNNDGDWP